MKTKIIIIIVILAAAFGLGIYQRLLSLKLSSALSAVVTYKAQAAEVTASQENKLKQLKNDLVYRLKDCESHKYTAEDAPMILDSNNEMSIGLWMYQRDTVIHYYKQLYGQEITRKDAVMIALDEGKARQLTEDILFTVEGGSKNWYNCSKRLGLPAEIAIIKKLQ